MAYQVNVYKRIIFYIPRNDKPIKKIYYKPIDTINTNDKKKIQEIKNNYNINDNCIIDINNLSSNDYISMRAREVYRNANAKSESKYQQLITNRSMQEYDKQVKAEKLKLRYGIYSDEIINNMLMKYSESIL